MSSTNLSTAAVMDAAGRCNLKTVQELVAAGASAKHLANKSQNAVTEACFGWWGGYEKKQAARLEVVRALVAAGCRVDGQALFRPVERGEVELVRYLLERGADPNTVAVKEWYTFVPKGCTPLGVAVEQGHTEVVAALVEAGADVKQRTGHVMRFGLKREWSPILKAAGWNRAEIIHLLAAAGADPNVIDADNFYGTALLHAISAGHVEAVEALVAVGANVNLVAGEERWHPLALAKEQKQQKIVKILERASAGVPKKFETKELLGKAAKCGDPAAVKKFLASGADVNATCSFSLGDRTPLMLAAKHGHEKVAKILLAAGAEVDATTKIGETALCFAADAGHAGAIRLLVAAGANVDVKPKAAYDVKTTPLIEAAERGHFEVVKVLVDHGADVRFRTRMGKTALSAAAAEGRAKIVRLLIAAINETKNAGRAFDTPLWWAVYGDHVSVVKLLLATGAKPETAMSLEGESVTALEVARKRRKSPIYRLLKDAVARKDIAKSRKSR